MQRLSIRLDHCVIASADLARSSRFYTQVFGAEVRQPHSDFRMFLIGGQMLSVHGPGAAVVAGPTLLAATPVVPGGSDLCFEWDGPIEDAASHLTRCAVAVETGPVTRIGARGRGSSIYFRDPDGSLLEFISYATNAPP